MGAGVTSSEQRVLLCCADSILLFSSYRLTMVPPQVGSLYLLLLSSFFLLFFVQTGDAIICFECNSHNDSQCALKEPPDQFKKDCTQYNNKEKDIKYDKCRKIVQTIEFEVNGMKPDTRVIRVCGYEKSQYDNRCYQRSGFGGRQEVCTCMTDLCNSADHYQIPLIYIAVASVLQLLATQFLF